MLTMAGSKMATRVAPSLLKAAGAEGLVVESLEEYEERAVSLATDPEKLFEVCWGGRCCKLNVVVAVVAAVVSDVSVVVSFVLCLSLFWLFLQLYLWLLPSLFLIVVRKRNLTSPTENLPSCVMRGFC